MTQEDKQLLLKDLCARLPYYPQRPKIHIFTEGEYAPSTRIVNLVRVEMWRVRNGECQWLINDYPLEDIKPYLRPMSSMTEEEKNELNERFHNIGHFFTQEPPYDYGLMVQHADAGNIIISEFSEVYDWLLSHHFDHRGLIPMGLALEATEGMYKTEQQ